MTVTVVLGMLLVLTLTTLQQSGIVGFAPRSSRSSGSPSSIRRPLIAKFRELSGERVRRIREEQRSEIAAHLHDSVLQTLALIQNRAGASSEVARLARAQERELRAWLYDGDSPADSDLQTDLRDYAGRARARLPGAHRRRRGGAVDRTRERRGRRGRPRGDAQRGTSRRRRCLGVHRGIRAVGRGLHPRPRSRIRPSPPCASDRLGVRESIIGRMRRAGGQATVRPGVGGVGTEVHLQYRPDASDGPPWVTASGW